MTRTMAAAVLFSVALVALTALVGVPDRAVAQQASWTGVAELSWDAVVAPAQPGQDDADHREALQALVDHATVRVSVAADGTRQQELLWDGAMLVDARQDLGGLPADATPENPPTEPFPLTAAVRVSPSGIVQALEDLGVDVDPSRMMTEGFGSFGPGHDGVDGPPPQLLPVLGALFTGRWVMVDGPFDPLAIADMGTQDVDDADRTALADLIDRTIAIESPESDDPQQWAAAVDVPALLDGLCTLSPQAECPADAGQMLVEGDIAALVARVDPGVVPAALLDDVDPGTSLTWTEAQELGASLHDHGRGMHDGADPAPTPTE